MLLVRILFFGSDFPLIKQGSAPVKIQKRENFSLLFVQRVDKVLNFLYNKGGKDRKLHKLCRRYAVCFRYFCDVSYPQLRELKVYRTFALGGWGRCILPAAAGIESRLPINDSIALQCILPAAAGIESLICFGSFGRALCILPAAAGIESYWQDTPHYSMTMYLTRSCGN